MRLRFALLCASALVAATATARAEPISLAILGAVGIEAVAGSFAAGVTTFALTTTASLGLSLAAKALTPKPKAGEPLTGVETQVQIGGDIARQICTGTTAVRGQLVFNNTVGFNNQYLQQVYVLSDWVSEGLEAIWFNGQRYEVDVASEDGGGARTYSIPSALGLVTLYFLDGSQTVAHPGLVAFSNPPGRWTSNSILTGMTYVIVAFTYQKDAPIYENGIPQIIFELKGAKLYDWRKDSTNGGSGSHRWGDVSTYEWTDNPVVATYNYLRGFYLGGERIIGMGVPPYDLILETFTAAANVCDEDVPLDGGGTEKRYRCSTILSADESVTHQASLDTLLSTYAGHLYDYAGSYYCAAGAAQIAVDTVTDDELVIGAPVVYAAKRSRADLVNRVHGQFLDPSIGFQAQSYGAQVDAGATTNDGEELGRQLDLMSVPSRTQAERIAKARLRELRAQATASITLGFNHVDKQVGDWLTWASARFGTKTYRIVNRKPDAATKAVTLDLEETNASVYSWTAADEAVAPAAPVRVEPGTRISTVSGFGLAAVTVLSGDGVTELPAIKAFWDPVTDETVDAVLVQIRPVGTTTPTPHTDHTPGDGEMIIIGLAGKLKYEARATIETMPSRVTTWTPWVQQLTSAMVIGSVTEVIGSLSAELQNQLRMITENIDPASLPAVRERVETALELLAAIQAAEAVQSYNKREEQRESFGALSASFTREVNLRITADSALAEEITTLRAELADEFGVASVAEISTRLATFVTPTSAAAIADTRISAKVTDGTLATVAGVTSTLAAYATLTDASSIALTAISAKVTDGTLATQSYVSTALTSYATTTYVGGAITSEISSQLSSGALISSSGVTALLGSYATLTDAGSIADTRITAQLGSGGSIRADVDTAIATRTTPSEATALASTQISAALGSLLASGTISFQAVTTPSGAEARYAILLKSTVDGAYHSTGFYMEDRNVGGVGRGRIFLAADEVYLGSDVAGTGIVPFAVVGGRVIIDDLLITSSLQLDNDVVDHANLVIGAATRSAFADAAAISVNTSSLTIRTGSSVALWFSFDGVANGSSTGATLSALVDGGGPARTIAMNSETIAGIPVYKPTMGHVVVTGLSAGSHTFGVTAAGGGLTNGTSGVHVSVTAIELTRQS